MYKINPTTLTVMVLQIPSTVLTDPGITEGSANPIKKNKWRW